MTGFDAGQPPGVGEPGAEGIYVKVIGMEPAVLVAKTTHGFPAWSPRGRYLAFGRQTGPEQSKIFVANARGQIRWRFGVGQYNGGPLWSPDGRRLLTGDRRGRISEWSFDPDHDLWEADTIAAFARLSWKQHAKFFGNNAATLAPTPLWSDGGHKEVWNVRYAPDGTRVAAVGAHGLSVLESGTGKVVYRRAMPALHGLDWSPDGAYIAAGAADHRIYVVRASDGAVFDRLEGHGELLLGEVPLALRDPQRPVFGRGGGSGGGDGERRLKQDEPGNHVRADGVQGIRQPDSAIVNAGARPERRPPRR